MDKIAAWMPLIEQVVLIVLPILAALLAWVIRRWVVAKISAEHRAMLATAAEGAYWVVEQIARKTPGKIDDKVSEAIRVVAAELRRPLDDSERATVVNVLRAFHEQNRTPGIGTSGPKP